MNIQPSWLNKLSQYGIYYIANRLQEWLVYFKSWKESQLLEYNKNMIADYVFYVMTVFCCFLQLHCQHCPKLRNLDRPLHAIFFFFGDQSAQSRESKISPSWAACLEKPIRTQDSLLNVLGHCQQINQCRLHKFIANILALTNKGVTN